ncbi:uncharacterized protein N7515_008166 [Penicillium bovifimosum]|uniref:Uncharacterized protein n=1 Tax=Penicillium bovifimosum TaxID=126998 RepID=A0A9W9GMF9_9EURO|nr:uncharacterized protein N7515_008166 [Penicillium bovifimosum]KAJ5124341.1 hypothetical protein N7515_008166 [Penicillium bovifimosum]
MPVKQARMREMASQALSPFPLGPNNTKSNAFHDIENAHGPEQQSHKVHPRTRRPEADSHLIGDETGLQGVFNRSMGYIVGTVLKAQSLDEEFADFKCLGNTYANTPDSILVASSHGHKNPSRRQSASTLRRIVGG